MAPAKTFGGRGSAVEELVFFLVAVEQPPRDLVLELAQPPPLRLHPIDLCLQPASSLVSGGRIQQALPVPQDPQAPRFAKGAGISIAAIRAACSIADLAASS